MILLDINTPEMDGIETALQVKQLHKGIKIVFISMHWELAIKNAIKNPKPMVSYPSRWMAQL